MKSLPCFFSNEEGLDGVKSLDMDGCVAGECCGVLECDGLLLVVLAVR